MSTSLLFLSRWVQFGAFKHDLCCQVDLSQQNPLTDQDPMRGCLQVMKGARYESWCFLYPRLMDLLE